ncbi:hypothetical protein IFM89_015499 [Coptis chinensis]|uniref:DNA-directed RNA polymerase III subunit RPC3 n=1 Tax=Coptis chinensis TaxID=261450 RepID=A0A835LDS8_9MAGN|nr:hypothetical protein IFM89_015499 [Coptis chinensis]
MVGQNGIMLAVNIISSHFGILVSKVCECLLRKGSLTIQNIVRFTELTPQQVKHSVLVLIQHNCVQAFSFRSDEDDQGGVPKGTHYVVIFENILHRLRFAKFSSIVSEQLDKESEELLEGLLQHGRLTLEQIILRALSKRNEGDCAIQDVLREKISKLVSEHFVERCPPSEPSVRLQDGDNSTRKRGTKSASFVRTKTLEQKVITAAVSLKRFDFTMNTGADVISEANALRKPANVTVGEKRKVEALEMDDGTIDEKDILWRANFEEFICHLKQKACIASVRSRLDDEVGVTLNAVLDATRGPEKKVKVENSVPLSLDAIFEEVIKSEEGRCMTKERVDLALSQMGCHPTTIGTKASYSVDVKNIIEIARKEEVESLISKRYGKDACRMFKLLWKNGELMETDKALYFFPISDTAFVNKNEALKSLSNLGNDGYLQMEKPVSQGAQSQFLLWKVNKSSLGEHVFDEMCHAALNLRLRLAYELEQEHEILQLPKHKRIGAEGKRYERIRDVNILLESSLMKLDEALMLFHDY